MRAVLDPNVLISALLTPHGKPTRVVRSWLAGAFELFVSESLLAELQRALGYPKLRALIEPTEAGHGRRHRLIRSRARTRSLARGPEGPDRLLE